MKKIASALLALTLLFALVACGGSAAPSSAPTSASAPSTSAPAADGPVAEEVKGITVPAFTVYVNGVEITQNEMAEYPLYSVQATSTNSSGTESTVTYVGFKMADILAAAGLAESYIWLQAIADDGYAVTLTGDIVQADTTLLAMTQDGSPFGSAPWFAPCSSETTGNYLKGCVNILVNTEEAAPDVEPVTPGETASESGAADTLPEILDRTDKVKFDAYSFLVNGEEVTNATLEGLSIYKITAVVTNNAGEQEEHTFTGYKLADVLKAVGAADSTTVKVVANDGFESTLTADMISSDHTLVAIERDGETGEDGTIWLAPCAQSTAGSYAKLVVEILAS